MFCCLTQGYPTALAHICLAFEPRPNQTDVPRGTLVMIPNADQKHLWFYLNTLMLDFAARLMQHLEAWVFDGRQVARALALCVLLTLHIIMCLYWYLFFSNSGFYYPTARARRF